jgi:hypothetical protein
VLGVRRVFKDGRPGLIVEMPGGYGRLVPVDWTSRQPTTPCPAVDGQLVLFDARLLLQAAMFAAEKLTAPIRGSSWSQADPARPPSDARASSPERRRTRRGSGDVRNRSGAAAGRSRVDRGGNGEGSGRRRGRR